MQALLSGEALSSPPLFRPYSQQRHPAVAAKESSTTINQDGMSSSRSLRSFHSPVSCHRLQAAFSPRRRLSVAAILILIGF